MDLKLFDMSLEDSNYYVNESHFDKSCDAVASTIQRPIQTYKIKTTYKLIIHTYQETINLGILAECFIDMN